MDPFHFEYGPAMGYTGANNSPGLTFPGQQIYSDSNVYESYGSQLHNEYAISQSKYTFSTGSGAGTAVAVGLRRNMGLGITNMDTSNAMGMGMNLHVDVYENAIGDMTSGTSSPYGNLGGTAFNVQSHLSPSHTLMSHEVWSANTGITSASSTRPIPIPLQSHHFRSAPQLALSPSVQSSPIEHPWPAYYYSASPAASASSMSVGSDDYAHRSFKPMNSSQPIPVSPSPSTPDSVPSPASLADKAPAEESPLLQRIRRKKPTHSFECQKCGKSFTRGADVKRHESSVHSPRPMDCPVENCVRKGSIGFPRRDHLMEHLRTFHNHDIPKRTGNRKRKACTILDD